MIIIIIIRTPIIEETESTVERELLSRDQSRRFRMSDSVQVRVEMTSSDCNKSPFLCDQDLSSLGDMSRDNLALSLTESRYRAEGPEPQYAETKSSILR